MPQPYSETYQILSKLAAPHNLPPQTLQAVVEQVVQEVTGRSSSTFNYCVSQTESDLTVTNVSTFANTTLKVAERQLIRTTGSSLHHAIQRTIQAHYFEQMQLLEGKHAYLTIENIRERFITGSIDPHLPLLKATLPTNYQVLSENYRLGQQVAVYVKKVSRVRSPFGTPGVEVEVSRRSPYLVRALLEEIVPRFEQIYEIVSLDRNPGVCSKIQLQLRSRSAAGTGTGTDTAVKIEQTFLDQVSELLWSEQLEVTYYNHDMSKPSSN